jgi:flavin reductase ActVB
MESAVFKSAMSRFPSGVTIVTTTDGQGRWWGFTASSFCSVSESPPLVLACLATSAQCHDAFMAAESWVVHVIHHDQRHLATHFATKSEDKFTGTDFVANHKGLPFLADSSVTLDCLAHARHEAGDHTILIGEVVDVQVCESSPVIYFERGFHPLQTFADESSATTE